MALMERYRSRQEGVVVDPVNEFRVRVGPGTLLKIASRATQFEWTGRPATLFFINRVEDAPT